MSLGHAPGAKPLVCIGLYIVQNLFHQGKGSRSISLNMSLHVFAAIQDSTRQTAKLDCIPGKLISYQISTKRL